MEPKDLDYFRDLLNQWLQELLSQADNTVVILKDSEDHLPDPLDRAVFDSERSYALRIRDRESILIKKIRSFMKSLNLPVGLKDAGVTKDGLEKNMDTILKQTPTDPAFYFGWYDLNQEQLKDIFLCAYDGKLLDMKSETWR